MGGDLLKAADFSLGDIAGDLLQKAKAAAGQAWAEIDLRNKPFASLLSLLVPGALMARGNWILAMFLSAAQEFGFGPKQIGEWLDSKLGFGSGEPVQLTDTALLSASSDLVGRVLESTSEKSAALRNAIIAKGRIGMTDIIANALHLETDVKFEKTCEPKYY